MSSLKESIIIIQDSLQVNKQLSLNIKNDLNKFKKETSATDALASSTYEDIISTLNKLKIAQDVTNGKIDYLVGKIDAIAAKLLV